VLKRVRYSAGVALLAAATAVAVSAQDPGPVLLPPSEKAVAPPSTVETGKSKRRVYVLHSGVHTISSAADGSDFCTVMRAALLRRGISIKDIVILDNPYPRAKWYNMFPKECLTLFMSTARPESRASLDAYLRMDRTLKAYEVSGNDELVWLGHSAGGQMGLTMAFLASRHAEVAALASSTQPYHFDSVITLGSPIASNYLPPEIKVRHYVSPQDVIPRRLARFSPPLLWVCGYELSIRNLPQTLPPGTKVRVFFNVEHSNWDITDRVVDRILTEGNPTYRPAWQALLCHSSTPVAIAPLLCDALEDCCSVTFEDPKTK
jgi:hypothetical protein